MKTNMDLSKWKEHFKGKNSLLILVLVGLILLVISIPTEKKGTATEKTEAVYENDSDYARQMENKLEKILDETEGVGNVSVMITLKSSGENVVEKDASGSVSSSAGESDTQNQTDSSETTVYEEQSDGTQTPYVTEKVTPEIDGVIIVADGGDDPVVLENITDAVKALFDVDMHKIKVMKRKSS